VTERALRRAGMALAGAGLALTTYLLYVRETGSSLACATGGCTTVQSSEYAELFGVPVAALGLAAYLVAFAAAAAPGELARLVSAVVTLSAAAFSGYLLYVQLEVIDALCQWCVVNDVLTSALAVTALLRLRVSPQSGSGRRPMSASPPPATLWGGKEKS
jgi:uncharacterized membrane protein